MNFFGITIEENPFKSIFEMSRFDYQRALASLFVSQEDMPTVEQLINEKLKSESLSNKEKLEVPMFNLQSDDITTSNTEMWDERRLEWEQYFKVHLSNSDVKYLKEVYHISFSVNMQSPRDIERHVNRYVKGQEAGVRKLSVPFFLHYDSMINQTDCNIKQATVVIGPTGCGKTETYRQLGNIIKAPIVRVNCTNVVPSDWKGMHISDILLAAAKQYGPEKMKYAVVIFDEFDKIFSDTRKSSKDGLNECDDFQNDIMSLFEKGYELKVEDGLTESLDRKFVDVPVDNMLLMFDGVFNGLTDIIRKRLNIGSHSVGFYMPDSNASELSDAEVLQLCTKEDLHKYGMKNELLGRIGGISIFSPLSISAMCDILLNAPDSVMQEHIKYCRNHNIDIEFSKEALQLIAQEAFNSGLGFRQVQNLLNEFMLSIYSEHLTLSPTDHTTLKIDDKIIAQQLKLRAY